MRVVKVRTANPYEIVVGGGVLLEAPRDIKELLDGAPVAVITDDVVRELLADDFLRLLREEGLRAEVFSFEAGEASKRMETVVSLARQMVRTGFDRKSAVIALGGGVVGDVAGFLASIYMRGIPYLQVPTTLLAQVDSSVGGKTGVDLPEGKNLLGTFYQPLKVYIDYGVLSTLPLSHLRNGLAEVVKYGCIWDADFFEFLEERVEGVLGYEPEVLERIIVRSCEIKAEVVSADERESGLRRVLNFGHTVGHALEAATGYGILHGEAVSVGMVAAARLSEVLGVSKERVSERIERLLERIGLPTRLPPSISEDDLLSFLFSDKKVWRGVLTVVLLERIGRFVFFENPPLSAVKEVLSSLKG